MAGLLIPLPIFQFGDAVGAAYSGGTLSSFLAGTTTPVLTYNDPDLAGGHSNGSVITLNSAGRPSVSGTQVGIYGDTAVSYKFTLKDSAGVVVWTRDNVDLPADSGVVIPSPSAPGQLIGTTDGATWTAMSGIVPAGSVLMYGAAAAPTGWLLCDGASYLRTAYASLFTVISTTYGAADGTHFNVPNCVGTFPFFKAAAGTGSTLGGTFGAIDHVHTGPSHTHAGPSHTHTYTDVVNHTHTVNVTDPGHVHGGGAEGGAAKYQAGGDADPIADYNRNSASATTGITAASVNPAGGVATGTTATGGTGNTGASGTGNTGTGNPPALVFTAIIKT
jgi:microcystin-dependent protein